MRLVRALSLLVVLAVPFLPSAPAFAQAAPAAPAAAAPATAREAFRRGEAAYSAGNYDTAVREWTNAYAVDPRPRIQFNLSQAYERMGQLENAIGALKRFLEQGDPEDPTYSDANARLVALEQRLASTGVMVQGGPEGGSILVDGQDWGRTPRPDKITTPPGNHVIVVRWASGREYRTNVYVPAGQVVNIQVAEDGSVAAPQTSTPAATGTPSTSGPMDAPPPSSNRKILWYSVGGGVAAVGVGLAIYGATRLAEQGKCGGDIYCDPDSRDSVKTQGIVGVAVGTALLLGGGALLVVGALSGRDDRASASRTSCGIGYASAACSFRF